MDKFRVTQKNIQQLVRIAGRIMLESDMNAAQLSDTEFAQRISEQVTKLGRSPLQITIDHKNKLLRTARQFAKNKEMPLAILVAATWVEHWINGFILQRAHQMKISVKHRNEMLRTVSLTGKYTWLLAILGSKPIAPVHVQHIRQLAEERNAFVHYKWIREDIDERNSQAEIKRMVQIFVAFEKTVKYLRKYDPPRLRRADTQRVSKFASSLRLPAD